MPCAGAQAVKLAVQQEDIAGLRDQDALSGQLLLDAHRAAICPQAHGPRAIETDEHVPRTFADRDGLRLQLRSINVHGELLLDLQMDRARV